MRQHLQRLEESRTAIAVVAVVVGFAVAVGSLGWPFTPEDGLFLPDGVRDVVLEHGMASDALMGVDVESEHFRLPGAIVLNLPVLLFPDDYLTWSAALLTIALLPLLVLASQEIAGRRGLLLAFGVPFTVSFGQGILHGALFMVVAVLIALAWRHLDDRQVLCGVLLGAAVTLRLWPALLLVPVMLARRWRVVGMAALSFVILNLVGLGLPGVSMAGTMESLRLGSDTWVFANHNGSLAAWLEPLDAGAPFVALAAVVVVWLLGLFRVRTLDGRLAWSLPAAILGSPLAWLPYLLALTPIAALYGRKLWSKWVLAVVFLVLAIGFRWIPNDVVLTGVLVAVGMVVIVEGDAPARDRSPGPVTANPDPPTSAVVGG